MKTPFPKCLLQYAFLLGLSFVFMTSCSLKELADLDTQDCDAVPAFSVNRNACNVPCTVEISNDSGQDAVEFFWEFGEGTTSQLKNPGTFTYEEVGNYILRLRVVCINGDTSGFVSEAIEVIDPTEPPDAKFTIENNNCFAPCTIRLIDQSTNATRREWFWNDELVSEDPNPEFEINKEAADVNIKLKVFNKDLSGNDREDTAEDILNVKVHKFEEDESLGAGEKIFQLPDHGFIIVGSTSSEIYVHRIESNGTPSANFPKTIPFSQNVTVKDAIQLSQSTFALVGTAKDPDSDNKERIVYCRFDDKGEAQSGPLFLEDKNADIVDRKVEAIAIQVLPGSKVVLVGKASKTGDDDLYFRVLRSDLSTVEPSQLFSGSDMQSYGALTMTVDGKKIFVGGSSKTGNAFKAAVFVLELVAGDELNLISDPPTEVSGLAEITSLVFSSENSALYFGGVDDNSKGYIGQLPASGTGTPVFLQTNIEDGTPNEMALSEKEDLLLIVGKIGKKAGLWTIDLKTGLPKIDPPLPFGDDSYRFFSGVVTSDCGFAACGKPSLRSSLYYVKTDQNGKAP